jgi:hypothetical protein
MSKFPLKKSRRQIWRILSAPAKRTRWRRTPGLAAVLALLLMSAAGPEARASTDPASACDTAARQASTEIGVPLDVLRAITRTETGRVAGNELRPWPWTVNMEGRGIWFDTENQARVHVYDRFRAGARSFDVGCFQLNYKWHGQAFNSIDEMFDPLLNARYAARFLKRLHAETGDWTQAAGAYHSRTQKHAKRYLSRYTAIREALPEGQTAPVRASASPDTARLNGFPLLRTTDGTTGSRAAYGSLVPLGADSAGSLFARGG